MHRTGVVAPSCPHMESCLRRAEALASDLVEAGVVAVNLTGAPGSGRTALVEATAAGAAGLRIATLSEFSTAHDVIRLRRNGIATLAMSGGQDCRLHAGRLQRTLSAAPWREVDLLFIENRGNLSCPEMKHLGQAANVVVLPVTECKTRPLQSPHMFRRADLVVLSKVDILDDLERGIASVRATLARVMSRPRIIAVSTATGQGIDRWLAWLGRARTECAGARRTRKSFALFGCQA